MYARGMKKNIFVKLNSKERSLKVVDEENYIVYLKSKPINNIANIELVELVAEFLNVPKSKVKILKGIKSRKKVLEITV